MASVRIVVWSAKKATNGTVPLYLVIRHKNQRSTIALPVRVKDTDWNASRSEVRKTNPDHYRLNLRLAETLKKARAALQDALFEDASISPHRIKAALIAETEGDAGDFLDYFESQLDAYQKRRQWATFEVYRAALNKLREYARCTTGRMSLDFDQLTVSFLEGFRTYLIGHCGNGKNTVHKNLASIRTILYKAIREGRFPQENNPFFQIRLEKEKRTKNKSIDIDDIWKIEDADLGEGRINDVLNCFLFGFYNAGMRVSDVIQLQGRDLVLRKGVWRVGICSPQIRQPLCRMIKAAPYPEYFSRAISVDAFKISLCSFFGSDSSGPL